MSKARKQISDQSAKGGLLGVFVYVMSKNSVDPILIGLLVPIISSVLAYVSTKIGDPELACIFVDKPDK